MKQVVQIVRDTSLYFQPQIRTKIMNEGWASYWHETLFMRTTASPATRSTSPGSTPPSPACPAWA